MKAYRQGDVSIMAAKKMPKGARRVQGEPILARGEVTGHAHRIVEGQVRLYQLAAGIMYLRVLSEFAKLYHEEHEDMFYPKATMRFATSGSSMLSRAERGRSAMPWTKRAVERIVKLTPAQEAEIPRFLDKWNRIATSAEPFDVDSAIEGMELFAEAWGAKAFSEGFYETDSPAAGWHDGLFS